MTEKKQKYQKKYRENPKNKEKAKLAIKEYAKTPERVAYRKAYRLRVKSKVAEEYQLLKKQVFDAMGSKCVKCGFSDYRALQIDHVNGDGFSDKADGYNGKKRFVQALVSFINKEGKYQLMCANCNWIKRFENNEHHKR